MSTLALLAQSGSQHNRWMYWAVAVHDGPRSEALHALFLGSSVLLFRHLHETSLQKIAPLVPSSSHLSDALSLLRSPWKLEHGRLYMVLIRFCFEIGNGRKYKRRADETVLTSGPIQSADHQNHGCGRRASWHNMCLQHHATGKAAPVYAYAWTGPKLSETPRTMQAQERIELLRKHVCRTLYHGHSRGINICPY